MAGRSTKTVEERLWAKVDKTGDCWLWTASLSSTGYGQINVGKGKIKRVHNLVCLLHHGDPPEGKENACHTCDNPRCCKPDHLYWGSSSDNMKDARDRNRVGGRQKLTAKQAAAIRDSKLSVNTLCSMYEISRWQVTNIRSGRQWKTG